MTFIISAATELAAFQVADTRLTRASDGQVFNDFAVKTIIVHCKDAKLAISYTGISAISGVRTDVWIADTLASFSAWEKVFVEVADHLKDKLNECSQRDKNVKKYGLELAIVGLGFSPEERQQVAAAVVTNASEPIPGLNTFRDIDPAVRTFSRWILRPTFPHYIQVIGTIGPGPLTINAQRRNIETLLRRLKRDDDPRPILNSLVAMLRLHRRDIYHAPLVGQWCIGVAITSDFNSVSVGYGPNRQARLAPHIVRATAIE